MDLRYTIYNNWLQKNYQLRARGRKATGYLVKKFRRKTNSVLQKRAHLVRGLAGIAERRPEALKQQAYSEIQEGGEHSAP